MEKRQAESHLKQRLATTGLIGLVAAGVAGSALPAQAQQSELDALRAQMAELQARLDKLESDQAAKTDAAKAAPPATAKFPVTLTGLLQVNGRGYSNQKGPGSKLFNTFQLRRGEIRVTGSITDRITGSLMIDPAKQTSATSTSTVAANGAVTTTTSPSQASNPLQEIVVSYLLNKTPRASHFIDVGQYKLPIGYEGDLVSSSAIPTVDRALMYTARDPFGGGNGDIRDTGVRLRGTVGPVDYQAAVFNGLGERQNALSAGTAKALVGRLMYSPVAVPGLSVGISGAEGNTGNTPVAGSRLRRTLFNTFANYQHDKWTARAEYLGGKNQALAATPGVRRTINGYYGLIGYAFTPKVEGVLRLDQFDFYRGFKPKAGKSNDATVNEITLGVNYYIKGNNAKIQANIVHRNGGEGLIGANGFGGNATGSSNSSTQLRTNFQVAF